MWLIHEHSTSTSAIDKYWIFDDENKALAAFKQKINAAFLDTDWYKELYDLDEPNETFEEFLQLVLTEVECDSCIHCTDGDYLVLTKADNNGFARRP